MEDSLQMGCGAPVARINLNGAGQDGFLMGFAEGTLTFQEFAVKEPLPLSTIQRSVLEFLEGRDDAVVYGAQAVNAYVAEPRMTQDVDNLSTRARELVDEFREYLHARFQMSIRVRVVKDGLGFGSTRCASPGIAIWSMSDS